MSALEPCDLHDLTGCAYCNGTEKTFQESIAEQPLPDGRPPRIPGGPTIWANYGGNCGGCGASYFRGEAIHHTDEFGWVRVDCCAGIAD